MYLSPQRVALSPYCAVLFLSLERKSTNALYLKNLVGFLRWKTAGVTELSGNAKKLTQ